MKIGLLDSGIGGLTVLHQALIKLPEVEYLYYADTDHVPYGTKPKEEVIQYVDEAIGFLVRQGARAVVIACNTATSVAIDYVRAKYTIPILGMEPAVKVAVKKSPQKRIMIMATPLTLREEKLKNLIKAVDEDHKVDLIAMPGFVEFAEQGRFDTKEVEEYIRKELSSYNLESYATIVLGCTHFNYFKDTLHKVFQGQVEFIDGVSGTVNHLKNILQRNGLVSPGISRVKYYMTGRLVTDQESLDFFSQLLWRADYMVRF